jgi:Na+-driven multidrug efflux pump
LGKKDFDALKTIQRRIQLLSILFLAVFFHGAILYPEKLIRLINPEEQYIQKSAEILRYISGSIFIFSLISVPFQTVNGSGNTRISFLIELISTTTYMSCAYYLIRIAQVDIFWVWTVEYIYFCTLGILSISYLRFFNWKQKII